MKSRSVSLLPGAFALTAAIASAATLTQTFEAGENTDNWNALWQTPPGYNGQGDPFLHNTFGGSFAGTGSSQQGQEASRLFRDNTAGLDVVLGNQPGATASTYTVSMYLQLSLDIDEPDSGTFHIIDGNYGESAVDIRIDRFARGTPFAWQVKNSEGGYTTLSGVGFSFGTPYFISFTVNPEASTASVSVAEVSPTGTIIEQGSLQNFSVGGTVFSNGNNGKLLFHIEGSAGIANFSVDNIVITDAIPEPASAALLGALAAAGLVATRRRTRPAA